jgi:hypothetical protein
MRAERMMMDVRRVERTWKPKRQLQSSYLLSTLIYWVLEPLYLLWPVRTYALLRRHCRSHDPPCPKSYPMRRPNLPHGTLGQASSPSRETPLVSLWASDRSSSWTKGSSGVERGKE